MPLARVREVSSLRLPNSPDLHVFPLSVRATTAGWTGSWAASTGGYPTVGHTSVGGPRVRPGFGNTFAGAPVRIGSATAAGRSEGVAARHTPVAVTFEGGRGALVPAGAQAFSDPLDFDVPADGDLLVSFHLPGTVTAAPVHRLAQQRSYVSEAGDHTADGSGTAYTTVLTGWPLLTGVDVGGGPGSVALLGDSITDGEKSTVDAVRRWPDVSADRISANRVVSDRYPGDGVATGTGGVSALHRLDRDVLAQTSVRTAVVFEGVDDLRWGATADEVVDRRHARGLRMLAATILPCAGEARCTASVDPGRRGVRRRPRLRRGRTRPRGPGADAARVRQRGPSASGDAESVDPVLL